MLRQNNIDVNVVVLSGAKDPDEYIKKFGIDAYKESIKHAVSLFDFKLNYLKQNKNLNKADELSEYLNNVINELNKSNDEILKTVTINNLSEKYNIDKKILENKLIKVEPKEIKIEKKVKKQKQNIRAIEEIIYYMMNSVKYSNIFTNELNYVPDKNYFEIIKDNNKQYN